MNPLRLADVQPHDVHWLWPGRIPLGKITLLVGDPGVGKSLVALDLAARVSTGAPWPDAGECGMANAECGRDGASRPATVPAPNSPFPIPHSPPPFPPPPSPFPPARPATVLLLTAEDDLADTVRPRLEAAGADWPRILTTPPGWSPDDPRGDRVADLCFPDLRPHAEVPPPPRPFDLRHDVRFLDGMLCRQDCRLLVIDPVRAFLGGAFNTLDAQVHHSFARLAALAANRRMAVVIVTHLRKQHGSALERAFSSLAFAAAARTTWLIAADPQDQARRLMLPIKSNLALPGNGLSFQIAPDRPGQPPVIAWSPEPVSEPTDDVLRQPRSGRPSAERLEAMSWLRVALAEGAKPTIEVQQDAKEFGLSLITLRRAFRDLGGESVRTGYGPLSEYFWRLPGVGDTQPRSTLDHLWENEPKTPSETR